MPGVQGGTNSFGVPALQRLRDSNLCAAIARCDSGWRALAVLDSGFSISDVLCMHEVAEEFKEMQDDMNYNSVEQSATSSHDGFVALCFRFVSLFWCFMDFASEGAGSGTTHASHASRVLV